jgi:Phosphate/sulphate permeases
MSSYSAIIVALIFIYTLFTGFNDGSNAVATTVATRAMKPRTAVAIAAAAKFFVPIIIYLFGKLTGTLDFSVAGNIAFKTVYPSYFVGISEGRAFVFMLSAIMGTVVWGVAAYVIKIPVSTSQTLAGGMIGAGVAAFGFSSILWKEYVVVFVLLMVFIAPVLGWLLSFVLMKILKRFMTKATSRLNGLLQILQRINILILASSFASNNAQKGLGIFMMMCALGLYQATEPPFWSVLIVAAALTAGMLLGGYRVISTLGRKIFKMHDVHSLVAQVTTSAVMIAATEIGISVSTGQVMSSAIMGVGAAERASGVRWKLAIKIALSWLVTLPVSAVIGGLFFLLTTKIFGL